MKDIDEGIVFERPNIYCHFAGGIGEPKYMPIETWEQLNKLLTDAMASYNDLIAAMNLVLFEDAMMHICRYFRNYLNSISERTRYFLFYIQIFGLFIISY